MKIFANTIVNNEENFIWFSLMSVIDQVDKVLVFDTGSNDNTVKIIEEVKKIKKDKIVFAEVGKVDKFEFTQMRQKMLDESDCDWILILDGDEIWWEDSIKKVVSQIKKKGSAIEGIVVPMMVPVGDMYHLQDESAGKYHILGKTGHLSLKVFSRKIPGLYVDWPYGREGFFDIDNRPIQEREKIVFANAPLLHVTHLQRSGIKRAYNKFKYELGKKVDKGFKFPEVLYEKYPNMIKSPWAKISGVKFVAAKMLTPLRKIKRAIL